MKEFPVARLEGTNSLVAIGFVNDDLSFRFLIDTGSSNIILDYSSCLLAGLQWNARGEQVLLETANGIIKADVVEVEKLECLGIRRTNQDVLMLDFAGRGISSNYAGILGLDFFEGYHFCINTIDNKITLQN
jgi:clan AA aspartic protease (TIGR02281 family)